MRFLQRIVVCDTVARLIVARFGRTPPKQFERASSDDTEAPTGVPSGPNEA
jgi:hypothetical protein